MRDATVFNQVFAWLSVGLFIASIVFAAQGDYKKAFWFMLFSGISVRASYPVGT